MPTYDLRATQRYFFDRQKVHKLLEKKRMAGLAKFGAFVRRKAKSSIRKSKKISAPGEPPKSHVGTLRNLIYFAYDPRRQTTVVGPVGFSGSKAPAALEHGGWSDKVARRIKTAGGERLTVKRKIKVGKRPFMHPAMQAELPKFADLFRG